MNMYKPVIGLSHIYIIISIISCNSTLIERNQQPQVDCIEISSSLPISFDTASTSQNDTYTVRLYYFENIRLCSLSYRYHHYTEQYLDTSENRTHYVIHFRDSAYGRHYDSARSILDERVKLDSILQSEFFYADKLYPVIGENIATQMPTTTSKNGDTLFAHFSITSKADKLNRAEVRIGYSNIERHELGPSLMKELDTIASKFISTIVIRYTTRLRPGSSKTVSFETKHTKRMIEIAPATSLPILDDFIRKHDKNGPKAHK